MALWPQYILTAFDYVCPLQYAAPWQQLQLQQPVTEFHLQTQDPGICANDSTHIFSVCNSFPPSTYRYHGLPIRIYMEDLIILGVIL